MLVGSLDKAGLNSSAVMASMSKSLVTLAKDGEAPKDAFKRVTGELQGFIASGDEAGAINLAAKVFGTKGASQFVGALKSGSINLDDLSKAAGQTSDSILGTAADTATLLSRGSLSRTTQCWPWSLWRQMFSVRYPGR